MFTAEDDKTAEKDADEEPQKDADEDKPVNITNNGKYRICVIFMFVTFMILKSTLVIEVVW